MSGNITDEEEEGMNNDLSVDGESEQDKENEEEVYNFIERE